ncbi:hypothetical protein EJ08DRAFT_644707 [Tothia fuscella]|uniref:Uncharacterized protein n=1 Tax=Tothia fuscella TaxID=1048955 RepID=A0A9P4P492_9PEZI|nr:hypothetical protein EJ08DRAFT_644707 [Tothia fuscella]
MDESVLEELLDDGGNFAPVDGHRLVEIYAYEDSTKNVFVDETLSGKQVREWVKSGAESRCADVTPTIKPTHGLRLLICSPRILDRNITPLPLKPIVLKNLLERWRIPSLFLRSICRRIPIATTYRSTLSKTTTGLLLRTNLSWSWQYALAMSHDTTTNITTALLVGLRSDETTSLISSLKKSKHAHFHILLPSILMDNAVDAVSQDAEARRGSLLQICYATGLHGFNRIGSVGADLDDRDLLDLEVMMQKLTSLADACAGIDAVCKTQARFIDAVTKFETTIGTLKDERTGEEFFENGQRLDFIGQLLKGIESKVGYTKTSAQGQVQTIYSLISQKDSRAHIASAEATRQIADESRKMAHLTRRDSTDMRIIAAVTMVFLPGTFTATLFSASFFDFTPTDHGLVSSWIWLYCVITFILTLFVLLAWWLFVRHQTHKLRKAIGQESRDSITVEMEKSLEAGKVSQIPLRPYLGSVSDAIGPSPVWSGSGSGNTGGGYSGSGVSQPRRVTRVETRDISPHRNVKS